jgi:hypothetical protein
MWPPTRGSNTVSAIAACSSVGRLDFIPQPRDIETDGAGERHTGS